MIDYRSLGRRVRYNRDRLGFTQEKLAEKINVSIPHISRIENGTSQPSLQVLIDLCNALDITIDELLQDSLSAARRKKECRLEEILSDCSLDELDMISNLAESVLRDARSIYRS
ncbi:MAG: helix-turn-helix transcriptional regulator [Clostridiales bacterium]|nr:helix-turn-helix transcriptional regulator [Clostridiales bacterium]